MSIVEETLRSQPQAWLEIIQRIMGNPGSSVKSGLICDLPPEKPKRVILFGLGSSHFAARLACFTLLKARIPAVAGHSLSIGSEIMPTRGDWAIGLSHRGGSKPTLDALQLCEQSGAFTMSVTGVDAKPMAASDLSIAVVPFEKVEPHSIAVTGALCAIVTLMLGDQGAKHWKDLSRTLKAPTPSEFEELKSKVGTGPDVILGEYEGEWLAKEAALKLMEMAGTTPRSFGSEEYFHGPRFTHKKSQKFWHVQCSTSIEQESRGTEIRDLLRPDSIFAPTGEPSLLSYISLLWQIQWASLAVASNLKVDPDHPFK